MPASLKVLNHCQWRRPLKQWLWPSAVFLAICGIAYAARTAIGTVYSSGEAVVLLRSLQQTGLFVGSAVATASATTLALMLTLIGMVRRVDVSFGQDIYCNIGRIAKLATASLMSSLILLLVLAFPVGKFEDLPANWFPKLYDGLFAGTTLSVGFLAATVALLYRTIMSVITKVTPEERDD